MIKRYISIILIIITLALVPLSGCSKSTSSGQAVCVQFLDFIKAENYDAAFELLASSVKNTSGKSQSKRVTKTEFANFYKRLREVLDITDIHYSSVTSTGGDNAVRVGFTMTYVSNICGEISDDFVMTARNKLDSWTVDWSPALIFPEMHWGDSLQVSTLYPERGEIFAGKDLLAKNDDSAAITLDVSKVKTYFDKPSYDSDGNLIEDKRAFVDTVINRIASIVYIEKPESIVNRIEMAKKNGYDNISITVATVYPDTLSQDMIDELEGIGEYFSSDDENANAIKCVSVEIGKYGSLREYPYKNMLAHIIGYVDNVDSERLEALNKDRTENLYTSDSVAGVSGIEAAYENELRGTNGKRIYIMNSDGGNRQTIYEEKAHNGLDVHLTIDIELQKRLEDLMQYTLYGDDTAGAVVVMNPKTGEINAMTSFPSYDLNSFTRGISATDYKALTTQKNTPLFNRLTRGLYPPGSVFKPFTAALALESGTLNTSYVFREKIENDYWIPKNFGLWTWSAIKRTKMTDRAEPLNMHNAIINSDNIYFANAALLIGEEKFRAFAQKIGLGESFDFDLNVLKSQFSQKGELTPKELADSGYGQAEMLITPIQMAATFSAFANNGNIPVPRVVEGLYEDDENGEYVNTTPEKSESRIWREGIISSSSIRTIEPMLKDVVDPRLNGTGKRLRVTSCVVAGKTGTAQIGDDKNREISWFVGYRTGVSADDERLVLVMLEVPADSEYSTLKFVIAKDLLEIKNN